MSFVLKYLCSVLRLCGIGIVLSLRAWVHAYCMLMVDVSYIIHAQFTACWHVMMYPLCSEYDLRKKPAVSDNNACVSAHVYMCVWITSKWICLYLLCHYAGLPDILGGRWAVLCYPNALECLQCLNVWDSWNSPCTCNARKQDCHSWVPHRDHRACRVKRHGRSVIH